MVSVSYSEITLNNSSYVETYISLSEDQDSCKLMEESIFLQTRGFAAIFESSRYRGNSRLFPANFVQCNVVRVDQ